MVGAAVWSGEVELFIVAAEAPPATVPHISYFTRWAATHLGHLPDFLTLPCPFIACLTWHILFDCVIFGLEIIPITDLLLLSYAAGTSGNVNGYLHWSSFPRLS